MAKKEGKVEVEVIAKRGRPTLFNPEIAKEIEDRLSNGEPLRKICRDSHMPNYSTVYDWRKLNEDFYQRIARAREEGGDVISEECIEIADAPPKYNDFGAVDSGDIQHRKLQIETRLKLLAKWFPKKYGDKLDVTSDGGPLFSLNLTISQDQADKIKKLTGG